MRVLAYIPHIEEFKTKEEKFAFFTMLVITLIVFIVIELIKYLIKRRNDK